MEDELKRLSERIDSLHKEALINKILLIVAMLAALTYLVASLFSMAT